MPGKLVFELFILMSIIPAHMMCYAPRWYNHRTEPRRRHEPAPSGYRRRAESDASRCATSPGAAREALLRTLYTHMYMYIYIYIYIIYIYICKHLSEALEPLVMRLLASRITRNGARLSRASEIHPSLSLSLSLCIYVSYAYVCIYVYVCIHICIYRLPPSAKVQFAGGHPASLYTIIVHYMHVYIYIYHNDIIYE